jgi:DNA-binding response OmpR family regulator
MNKKIVVVDDDVVTLQTLEKILVKSDFYVFSAPDGEAAYQLVKKERPDILVSDMLIPKLHGLELCRKVKEDPELAKTKVILISAVYKSQSFRGEMQQSGADGFLEKPINTAELMIRIFKIYMEIATEEEGNSP